MTFKEALKEAEVFANGRWFKITYELTVSQPTAEPQVTCKIMVIVQGPTGKNVVVTGSGMNWTDVFIKLQSNLFLETLTTGVTEGEAPE